VFLDVVERCNCEIDEPLAGFNALGEALKVDLSGFSIEHESIAVQIERHRSVLPNEFDQVHRCHQGCVVFRRPVDDSSPSERWTGDHDVVGLVQNSMLLDGVPVDLVIVDSLSCGGLAVNNHPIGMVSTEVSVGDHVGLAGSAELYGAKP